MVISGDKKLLVRKADSENQENTHIENHVDEVCLVSTNMTTIMIEKKKRMRKIVETEEQTLNSESDNNAILSKVSTDDLEELREVYNKCKKIIKKIESKYGCLLNLKESEQKKSITLSDDTICDCASNKKIIYDDDGHEVMTECALENHICPKKLKKEHKENFKRHLTVDHIHVSYDLNDLDTSLPDDIQSLTHILHDSTINNTYRNKVIHKIKLLRQEYADEIRFNKKSLVEKLKSNPDEVFKFNGTNLTDLPGYIY